MDILASKCIVDYKNDNIYCPMKLIIAGGRDFSNYKLFSKTMEDFVEFHGIPSELISGKCPTGADYYGERWAETRYVSIKGFPADWNKHGKVAGPIRNKQMAEHADRALIFWDGKSKGSKG